LKFCILLVLVLQTSATVVLFRYSLTNTQNGYVATTVVFCTECVKYLLSLTFLFLQHSCSVRHTGGAYFSEVIAKPRQSALLAVPALLYTVQNNILIIALKNLDAATYQVTYQLKILTTAAFSVLLLKKELSCLQWFSLLLLSVGVALVQIPSGGVALGQTGDQLTGLMAVLTACLSSGFAGVYYERLVKTSSQPSIIIRNLQLGIFSITLAAAGMVFNNFQDIHERGLFHGYSTSVVCVILLQAGGGLVVAASIKYADNILKGFATSLSILVSGVVSWLVMGDLQPGKHFLVGTALVLFATGLYCRPVKQPKLLPA